MRITVRHLLLMIQLLAVGLVVLSGGCDRTDNDWHLYDPDDKLLHVPLDTLSLQEDAGETAIALTIGMVPADTVFVFPVSRDSQVSWRPDSLVFAPVDDDWLRPRTLTVVVLPDRVEEGPHADELSFLVRSGDERYDGQGPDLTVPILIADNDVAGVAVSETLLTLVESEGGAVFESYRLVLTSRPTEDVTVNLTVTPEETSLHVDPMSVTFAPDEWDQPREISLWIELDSMDQDYQSLVISHAGSSVDTFYGPGLAIADLDLEIFDDTLPPVATVAMAGADTMLESSVEGLDVVVTLSRPSVIPVTLHLATVGQTATGGSDFPAVDMDVVFQPGDPLTRTFTLLPTDDSVLEYTESFEVVITAVEGLVIGAEDRVQLFIADDDLAVLSLSDPVADEDSGGIDFEVTLDAPTQFPVSFTFFTHGGTATEDEDYEGVVESFTLEPGQSSRLIPVILYADDVHEPDETFTATLGNLSENAVWTDPPAVGTIVNDDPQNITFADIEHHEVDGSAVFTIELARPYPADVNLTVTAVDGDGAGDPAGQEDALVNSDFQATNAVPWVIPGGALSADFAVTLFNDDHAEALNEHFRLRIDSGSEPGFAGLEATCTIIDDHQPCIRAADVSVGEGDGSAVFTLALYDGAGNPTTSMADVTLQVDTMDQTATAGDDYTAVSTLVTITPGQPSVDVTVPINDDTHDDDNENFVVLVTGHVNAVGNCDTEPPFGTIVDDEFPSINLESSLTRLNEGSVFIFQVSLTTPRQVETVFTMNLLPGTSQGHGVDYNFDEDGIHTIPPFTDFITFTAPFLDDQLEGELDEDIEVVLGSANCALGVVSLPAVIVDAPELTIAGSTVDEGEDALFTITAEYASTADMTFYVQYSSGTAVAGSDFSEADTGPFTIPAGDTFVEVPVPTMALDGGDYAVEEFYVTVINPVNATVSPFNSGVSYINDTDPSQLYWAGTGSAVEGDDILLTVNLSWLSNADITFGIIFTDGTAARLGIDYDDADVGPFTIPAGSSGYEIAVPTSVDGLSELAAEDFYVTLDSPTNAVLGSPLVTTGFVLDADQPQINFTANQSGLEGGTLTFIADLDRLTTVPVTFDIEYDNGSTQGAADFDVTNVGPFTIPAGTLSVDVTVDTVEDGAVEGVESFIIRIANPDNALPGAQFEAAGTIVDDD